MRWRKPEDELPGEGQRVWVMVSPHKDRGGLWESAMSIHIVCGETSYSADRTTCRVDNGDELGQGNVSWYLAGNLYDENERAIAWMPVAEMFAGLDAHIPCGYCGRAESLCDASPCELGAYRVYNKKKS
jgi:hypothetical protein